jgi:hypothetical protein
MTLQINTDRSDTRLKYGCTIQHWLDWEMIWKMDFPFDIDNDWIKWVTKWVYHLTLTELKYSHNTYLLFNWLKYNRNGFTIWYWLYWNTIINGFTIWYWLDWKTIIKWIYHLILIGLKNNHKMDLPLNVEHRFKYSW